VRRSTWHFVSVLSLAGLILPFLSHAALLYSALPNQSGASEANNFLEADDFTLSSPARLGIVNFWTLQTSPADYAGSIAWSLRRDAAGLPGAIAASGTAAAAGATTGKSAFGFSEFSYTLSMDVTLSAGKYWIVLHNGPNNITPTTDFFLEWSNANAGNSMSQDLGLPNQPWVSNFAELALQLEDIPEPSSMLLAGAGLLAVWLIRGRKHNR
jgi:hypothetical protein